VHLERLAPISGGTHKLDAWQLLHALDASPDDIGVVDDHQSVCRLAHG